MSSNRATCFAHITEALRRVLVLYTAETKSACNPSVVSTLQPNAGDVHPTQWHEYSEPAPRSIWMPLISASHVSVPFALTHTRQETDAAKPVAWARINSINDKDYHSLAHGKPRQAPSGWDLCVTPVWTRRERPCSLNMPPPRVRITSYAWSVEVISNLSKNLSLWCFQWTSSRTYRTLCASRMRDREVWPWCRCYVLTEEFFFLQFQTLF